MPHLNTGLAMKREHESRHNACRRLYVANPGVKATEITKQLRAIYMHHRADGVRQKPFTVASTVGLLEAAYCSEHRLPYEDMPADPSSQPCKNCPVCAAQIYHANLYELPWLTHCPLHGHPLLEHCPDCQQRWPMDSEVAQRRCNTCGIPSSMESLVRSGAFAPRDDHNALNSLQQCIDRETKTQQCCVMYHDGDDISTNHIHCPTQINDRFYPTILAAQSDSNCELMARLGVTLERHTHWKMDLSTSGRSFLTTFERLNTNSAQRARRDVYEVIIKSATIYQGSDEPIEVMEAVHNNLDLNAVNLFSLALTLWEQLVYARPLTRMVRTHAIGTLLDDPSLQAKTPAPMDRYYSCPEARFSPILYPEHSARLWGLLPDTAQDVVYRLDLWALYVNLYAYLSQLRVGQMQGMSQRDFLTSLPDLALPCNACSYPLDIVLTPDEQLNLMTPACLSQGDLEQSLRLFLH